MNERLHGFLVALTLLDLGFVHATDAVSGLALLPLWLFALAAPRLRRLQRHRTYRGAWNVGVLIVFALLVHHATTTGLLHMLEDGLVLAVLCQVHLLNNVGSKQRPDLTFFNSFLITFVTSFFAPDVWWSVLFVAHMAVFVPALQVYVLTRGGRTAGAGEVRAVLRDAWPRTAAIGAVTVLVFVFWPRDFHRRGFLQDQLAFGAGLQSGMAERIELDRGGSSRLGDTVALRVEPIDDGAEVPTHWRAIAFSEFDGRTWYPQNAGSLGTRFASDTPWQRGAAGAWRRPSRAAPHTRLRVQLFDRGAGRLPTTLSAVDLQPVDLAGHMLDPKSYAGFGMLRVDDGAPGPISYVVSLAQPQAVDELSPRTRGHFTHLPERGVPRLAYDLGRRLRDEQPADCDHLTLATAVADWLQQNRRYELPGEPGFADNFGQFLLGTAPGHCEYFATALALVLRTQGVPCRVVGGYLVHELADPEAATGARIARERDAHAWVEVLAADGTWHTLDATPAADVRRRGGEADGFWSTTGAWLQSMWAEVTAFDDESRRRFVRALWRAPIDRPALFWGGAVLVFAWLRRRRRRSHEPTIASFERALRRLRLTLRPGETPRELVDRAAADERYGAEQLAALRAAASAHERARYGAPR